VTHACLTLIGPRWEPRRARGRTLRRRDAGNRRIAAGTAGLVLAMLACAGCGHEENRSAATPTLVAMPAAALARCTRAERLRPVCPTRVPDSKWQDRPGWDDARGEFAGNGLLFELQAGAQHRGQAELDSPPRFVHVALGVGPAPALLPFSWPPAGEGQLRNGLLRNNAQRSTALSFGQGGEAASMGNCCWRLLMSAGAESSELT
jgi:hypothetical protein